MESTAERVAALLFEFESGPQERSVGELARAVGRERSQISRMLKSLERGGLVEQDSLSRLYRLSWRLRVLANGAGNEIVTRACKPILRTLVARSGEVALLSVQEGDESLTVLREESNHSLQAGGWVGRRSPMYCTASGRALLFDTTGDDLAAILERVRDHPAPGPNAPRDSAQCQARLAEERALGYAVASEEVELGLTSVSAPVRGRVCGGGGEREIVGVINVSGPTSRLLVRVHDLGNLVSAAAQVASRSVVNLHTSGPGR